MSSRAHKPKRDSRRELLYMGGSAHLHANRRHTGFTLVEVMVAVVLLGIGISAVLFGLGVSHNAANEGRRVLVAGDLASCVGQFTKGLAFADPGSGEPVFGPEEGETGFGQYDDIDDLNGLILSPPIAADGSELPSFGGWSQRIAVAVLDPETLVELEPQPGGTIKRVDVSVYHGSRKVGLYQWIMTAR